MTFQNYSTTVPTLSDILPIIVQTIMTKFNIGDKVIVIGTKYVGTVVDNDGGKCVVHFDNIGTDFSYSADVLELCDNDIENNSNTIPTVESTNTKITVGK